MTNEEAKRILMSDADFTGAGGKAQKTADALCLAIDALEKQEADGCYGCAFEDVEEWEMPCAKCKRNNKDYWRVKA